MPLLKHARKKLKQDKKRTAQNKKVKDALKLALKKANADKNPKSVSAAYKAIDKAVKANLIHKNKAARTKSGLSKLIAGKPAAAKTTKTEVKPKTPAKKQATKAAPKSSKTTGTKTKKSSSKTSK